MTISLSNYSDVLTPKEVREILHIGRTWTYRLLKNGDIPSFRVGSTYRIPKEGLVQFINTTK